jgi:hypothetical protein
MTIFLLASEHGVELLDAPVELSLLAAATCMVPHITVASASSHPKRDASAVAGTRRPLGFQQRRRMGSRSGKITAKRVGHGPGIENIGVPSKHGSAHHRGLSLGPPDAGC